MIDPPPDDTRVAGRNDRRMLTSRHAGAYAVAAAAASVVVAPLLSLSYHATAEGAAELQAASVAAWSEPGRDLAGGLLTFATPDRVYATYLQLFALLFPAVLVCAHAVRARRPEPRGLERWGWRIALTGYWMLAAGLAGAFFIVVFSPNGPALDVVFMPLILPGLLASTVGSSLLGIALLRARYAPRATAWLLAPSFPVLLAASTVLGHNSLGLVPLLAAWGVSGAALSAEARRSRPAGATPRPAR